MFSHPLKVALFEVTKFNKKDGSAIFNGSAEAIYKKVLNG
jgi:hypothetical protein